VLNNKQQKLTAQLSAQGYEGTVDIKLTADTGKQTTGTLTVNMTGLNVTQLTELQWITGTFNANSNTRFNGRMMSDILDSLDGTTNFTVDDGALDVASIKSLAAIIDRLRGKTSRISEWPDKMPFEHLEGVHTFSNGVADNQTFGFQLENLKVAGTGGYDYWQDYVDYDIQVTLEETDTGLFQVNPRLAGINWPLHCKGTLDRSPVEMCLADAGAIQKLAADAAKQEVKREAKKKAAEKIEEKVPEDMREDAKKLLKGLFNQ